MSGVPTQCPVTPTQCPVLLRRSWVTAQSLKPLGLLVHLYIEIPSEHSDARDRNSLLKGSDVRLILSRYSAGGPQRGSHRSTGTATDHGNTNRMGTATAAILSYH
ncbi:hypothetical protein FKM82_029082 [Ascaphus truei]